MNEVHSDAIELLAHVGKDMAKLKIADAEAKLKELKAEADKPDFWKDNKLAQSNLKEQAKIESKIKPWHRLHDDLAEIIELSEDNDFEIDKSLEKQLKKSKAEYIALTEQLKYNGPYDDHDVIISIYAGAGGTDAQDWAQMLERMYLRWAEANQIQSKVLEESSGDEAGIKSVIIELEGNNVYGQLKGEQGVHRLVRLSPFNADHLRQTSFAKVEVLPKIDSPDEVQIDDKDLKIDVFRSGGHGGQSVNTTDSAVRVTHLPTGITVTIQNERSQLQNKETALTILRSHLAQLQQQQHTKHLDEIKGPNQSAEWGNQIRSYVLHPYKQVKNVKPPEYETSDIQAVLDGKINGFLEAYAAFDSIATATE